MKRWLQPVLAGSAALLLAACAPVTRVILLPQSAGATGALEVKTANASLVLAAPYQMAVIDAQGHMLLAASNPLAVMDRYGAMLAQLPAADEHFLLYFEVGDAQLTPPSQAMLPSVLARARARLGGEIVVIGHTDRVGALEANDALSLQRARSIRQLLVSQGFDAELIEAVGRGERAPLLPTADEVAEPKNRRAEIVVR